MDIGHRVKRESEVCMGYQSFTKTKSGAEASNNNKSLPSAFPTKVNYKIRKIYRKLLRFSYENIYSKYNNT